MVAALTAGGAGAGPQGAAAVPRGDTLYTSGKQWGPYTNFNPLRPDYNTGIVGLVYETLFRYDPLKDRFIPWLASSGKWVGRNYVVTLRNGVKWNDGKALTAADVKFTFETQKNDGRPVRDDVEDRPAAVSPRAAGPSRSTSGASRTIRNGTRTGTRSRSCRGTSGGATAPRRSSRATPPAPGSIVGTGPFTYGGGAGGSQTLQWNRRDELVGHEGPRE